MDLFQIVLQVATPQKETENDFLGGDLSQLELIIGQTLNNWEKHANNFQTIY